MSEVYEVTPASCPECGADWTQPGAMIPGWDSGTVTGQMGHRIWTCDACGATHHPEKVELRER